MDGPLIPPMIATGGVGGLTETDVHRHRREFYEKMTGLDYDSLGGYVPPVSAPNLKTRAQLEECVFVAGHWDTGTEDLDVMSFRRQHKNFYTKMKICDENIGRRTGHHLRSLAGSVDRSIFCRYGKNGESLMYIPMEELYDAIFEIHTLKGHRGWQNCKKLINLKYANVPQDQIRAYIETCPICMGRKKIKSEEDNSGFVSDRIDEDMSELVAIECHEDNAAVGIGSEEDTAGAAVMLCEENNTESIEIQGDNVDAHYGDDEGAAAIEI